MFKKNQKTTLVLSGGAALGFAHFGAIKIIQENKINISEIIGTSMGSIASALLACQKTTEEIIQILEEINYLKLLKINIFSLNSLLDQHKIRKFLSEKIGEINFSQTKIDLKIIATNIETGEIKIFDKTNTPNTLIIDAICASIAIPGIFKPYKINEQTYVDGFLTSNLPFEQATNKKIIAIDVITQNYINNLKYKYSTQILEKSILISILNQTKEKLKTNKNKLLQRIEINLEEFKPYDFHKSKQIIEKGYSESLNKLNSNLL
jgi:NTE family protein